MPPPLQEPRQALDEQQATGAAVHRPLASSGAGPRRPARPVAAPAFRANGQVEEITTRRGDSFWSLAEQHLGSGNRWIALWMANRDRVPNRNALPAGITLRLPRVPQTDDSEAGGGGTSGPARYVVQPGDNLQRIAAQALGDASKWRDLWTWNRDQVPNPSHIRVGQSLRLGPRTADGGGAPGGQSAGGGDAQADDTTPRGDGSGVAEHRTPPVYEVRPGDTLSSIARRELGSSRRWQDLWAWNRGQLANPNRLRVGMALRMGPGGGPDTGPGVDVRDDSDSDSVGPSAGPQDDPEAMAPDGPRAVGASPLEKALAGLYNSKGKLIHAEASRLGIEPAVAGAVLHTESAGSGFSGGKLVIRFEAHIFRDLTGQYVRVRHTGRQSDEYEAFERAKQLDHEAAHDSISMGAAQIMGFNAERIGYGNAVEMFEEMAASEAAQTRGFFEFVRTSRALLRAAQGNDWATFAKLYNGPGYRANRYDTKMAAAYAAWKRITADLPYG